MPDLSEQIFLITCIIFKHKYFLASLPTFSDRPYAQVRTLKGTEQKSYTFITPGASQFTKNK